LGCTVPAYTYYKSIIVCTGYRTLLAARGAGASGACGIPVFENETQLSSITKLVFLLAAEPTDLFLTTSHFDSQYPLPTLSGYPAARNTEMVLFSTTDCTKIEKKNTPALDFINETRAGRNDYEFCGCGADELESS
jgi:hypothetical protein